MARKETDEEIIKLALERFKEIEDYEGEQRQEMLDDKEFSLGIQWSEDERRSRRADGRACFTIQRSKQFSNFVKNQQRKFAPSIKISPTDEGAQEIVAERRQGVIRHIQYDSKSVMARTQAYDDAVDMGRGHYLVTTDWVSPDSLNQKIVVEPIKDPLSVYMDINREKPDYSDCNFGFIVKSMRRSEFQEKYPDATSSSWSGTSNHKWVTKDQVTVAKYYFKKAKTRKLIVIEGVDENGKQATTTVYEDKLERELHKHEKIIRKREVEDPEWWCYTITSQEVLDKKKLVFKEMPICTTIGSEDVVDGRLVLKGLLRDIKDPLRMYNYVASQEAMLVALAPKAPWVMAEGQDEGYESMWANANIENQSALIYKPTSFEGHLNPAPQRTQFAGTPQGLVMQRQEIIADCMAITGIHEAALGQRSNETSGVAIRARQGQGENSTFHFTQNGIYTVTHEGRVINSGLEFIYDTERTIEIMGEDDEKSMVPINAKDDPGLGTGNFSVTVSTGPTTDTARQEQAMGMIELIGQVPLIQNVASDLVVRSQDWVGKDALADRLEFAIEHQFPGITTQKKPDGENDEVMFLQQQLQQLQQQLQQMGQQSQQLQQMLQKADADKQAAEAGKVQIMLQEVDIKRQELGLKQQQIQGDLAIKQRQLEIDAMKADLDSETKLTINDKQAQKDLIIAEVNSQNNKLNYKIQQQGINTGVFDAVTRRMSAEQNHLDSRDSKKAAMEAKDKADKEIKQITTQPKAVSAPKPQPINITVNVPKGGEKKSIINKNEDGTYEVTTTEDDAE
jgi:hypothetical protein